ncbi:PIN domain-containing protein [Terrarubrum flagellatum]|uniref:PIN domain-containing protein n=1 Tax=Terrirubrum flagellatum TaxID=2895980 RepID=UPI003144E075
MASEWATCFLDTNILIYSKDPTNRQKQATALHWMSRLAEHGALVISPQVLNELYNVAIQNRSPLNEEDARRLVVTAGEWCSAQTSLATTIMAIGLRRRTSYQWFDCLLLASALDAGCAFFVSEDMQHDHLIDGMRIINPFVTGPDLLQSSTRRA